MKEENFEEILVRFIESTCDWYLLPESKLFKFLVFPIAVIWVFLCLITLFLWVTVMIIILLLYLLIYYRRFP
jgi:hypothetical protein